ncbi:MAG: hypothetical protein DRP37_04065 [Thermodesulfobacteriota bacterium]|nr:MAG: hypothetical protein DRP37_04065 [Thermodesulfobacteriota bacterium]
MSRKDECRKASFIHQLPMSELEIRNQVTHLHLSVFPNFYFPVPHFIAKIQDQQSINYFRLVVAVETLQKPVGCQGV